METILNIGLHERRQMSRILEIAFERDQNIGSIIVNRVNCIVEVFTITLSRGLMYIHLKGFNTTLEAWFIVCFF